VACELPMVWCQPLKVDHSAAMLRGSTTFPQGTTILAGDSCTLGSSTTCRVLMPCIAQVTGTWLAGSGCRERGSGKHCRLTCSTEACVGT
jgi:hypothetical protein